MNWMADFFLLKGLLVHRSGRFCVRNVEGG